MALLALFYPLFGLAVGSFLNVCIHRIPRRESVVHPGSHCTQCGAPVRPYDNIPLVSYVFLRGRCRSCRAAISWRYPLVELTTGLAFYICGAAWDFSPATFINSLFLCIIIVLIFIDYDHQILPNVLTLPGLVLGIFLSPFQSVALYQDKASSTLASALNAANPEALLPWVGSVLGALVGGGLLLLTAFAYQAVRKRQGLGMGDVKMMAMVGAFLGWRLALLTVFTGSLLGSLVGLFLMRFRGGSLQTKLAFGTFLGSGAALSLFFGLSLLHWYISAL